jgi:menaquinone-specific isochorismate synthase
VQPATSFAALLAAAGRAADRSGEDGVLSLALPLACLDPLALLPRLADEEEFRFLWDGTPGLCVAAAGRCQHLELSGPRRFELARRFSQLCLSRLTAMAPQPPPLARPRVLLAFSFFEGPLGEESGVPGLQAVLPRWQLSRHGRHCWLRLQRTLGGGVTARSMAEELWQKGEELVATAAAVPAIRPGAVAGWAGTADGGSPSWQRGYRRAVARALELVEAGELRKLVLAVRQELRLPQRLDPLTLLAQLRRSQPGSCRFLWQPAAAEALLGASPERLLTVRQGRLRCDALAGTAALGAEGVAAADLLSSAKDRHEHELVVEAITQALRQRGLTPRQPRHPRLARHGGLLHLHTPITAELRGRHPLVLADALHPTPAVAGLPRRQAMAWLRSLESFDRGNYAAPIGWIDSHGDIDLRVAIRSGRLRGRRLELTAGAGLVRGSHPERELREVGLKLDVLLQQLNLAGMEGPAAQAASSRAIV